MDVSIAFGKTNYKDQFTSHVIDVMPSLKPLVEKSKRAPAHFIAFGLDPEQIEFLEKKANEFAAESFRLLLNKDKKSAPEPHVGG